MPKVPLALRDRLITEFRQHICAELNYIPLLAQAQWWAATDGKEVIDAEIEPDSPNEKVLVKLADDSTQWCPVVPRPAGRAKVVALLAAYKMGKSWSAGVWASGFAAVPESKVVLVGLEYDMCAAEFDVILETLLSTSGLGLKAASLQNRPKDGRLWLQLENGARFEARSWERSESLKGKEVDCYIFSEAYQLPGLECFTSVAQNLRARNGYAVFPTTPDRPWVQIFHENGHGHRDFPAWSCHCGVPASANPYTFDQSMMDRDAHLMTREKFNIAYLGKLGDFVGRVYAYQRGDKQFNAKTHPHLWHSGPDGPTRANLKIPSDWRVEIGADTGSFCAAVVIAFDPEGNAYVLDEIVNYSYLAGQPELDPAISLVTYADNFKRCAALHNARPIAWCDSNSQFKAEFTHHGVTLMANTRGGRVGAGREVRTEAGRQYFQHNVIWFAPWLKILPYEIENAQWPPKATASGRYERLKVNDHALDSLEHVLSRHPRGTLAKPETMPELPGMMVPRPRRRRHSHGDPHLGDA